MEKQFYGIIYKSICIITRKSYIGKTTRSLNYRAKNHLGESKNLNRKKTYFHNAILKHGYENFIWEQICFCYSRKELDEIEKLYIDKFNTKYPNGYNLANGGTGSSGWKHTEEWKQQRSELTRGKKIGPMPKGRKLKISESLKGKSLIDLHGFDKAEEIRKHQSEIRKGKTYEEIYGKEIGEELRKKRKLSKFGENTTERFSKNWKVIKPNGEEVIIRNLRKFCRENNLCVTSMQMVAHGRRNSYKGWKCILL